MFNNTFKLVSADKFEGDLVGREVVVAPQYQKTFGALFKELNPHTFFRVRTVWQAGDCLYLSFVESPRDPDMEFVRPYDGTTDARYFHVMP